MHLAGQEAPVALGALANFLSSLFLPWNLFRVRGKTTMEVSPIQAVPVPGCRILKQPQFSSIYFYHPPYLLL